MGHRPSRRPDWSGRQFVPLFGDVEHQFLVRLHRRQGAEFEPVVGGRHLYREVVGDHEKIDRQLQHHPPGTQTFVGAEPVGSVSGTVMLKSGRQVAVDVEFERVGKDILHVMGGCLCDVNLRSHR